MTVKVVIIAIVVLEACATGCSPSKPRPLTREAALDRLRTFGLQFDQKSFVDGVRTGSIEVVGLYLDAGIDPNGQGEGGDTPLSVAATHERDDVIRLLIARGADPDRPTPISWTPLHWAALRGSIRAVRALLDCGANANAVDMFGTPVLCFAVPRKIPEIPPAAQWYADQDHIGCLKALLDAGADVNAGASSGHAALIRAAESSADAAALLIGRGADLTALNKDGKTAKQVATESGRQDIVAVIEKAGG